MSINYKSPKGSAGFLNIVRPDTKFDPEGKYKVTLNLAETDAAALQELAKEVAEEAFGTKKAAKAHIPGKENEDGSVAFTFKSNSQPKVFDAKGNPVRDLEDLNAGSGSTIRVKGSIKEYDKGGNFGVTLYLNSVQIIKLVEYGGGFEADEDEEDGYVAAPSNPKKPKQDAGGAEAEVPEEVDF